jgi:putative membrane protein
MKIYNLGGVIAVVAGITICVGLVVHNNASFILDALQETGWGFPIIFLIQVLSILCGGLAWRSLFHADRPGFTRSILVIRWIRESINYMLPVARLGGEMAAVRLLVMRGHDVNLSIASLVVDKTVEFFSLFLFALPGLIFLLRNGEDGGIRYWTACAMAALVVMLIIFLAAQRWGLLKLADRAVKRVSGAWSGVSGSSAAGIHEVAWSIYASKRRITFAAAMQTLSWMPGALQVWVALNFMGFQISLSDAFILECLTQIICAAAFIMPAALGAQEAAYMTIGWWFFGLPPAAGLALSLAQRLKDVVFGTFGLLVWQGYEGRHLLTLWRRRKA